MADSPLQQPKTPAQSKFDTPPRDIVPQPPIVAGITARFSAANTAELYYDSLQYTGLSPWDAEVALSRRRPREIVPLFKTAIDTVHAFVWGGARFPRIVVAPTRSDDDADNDDEIGPRLWPDDALDLTTFVQQVVREAKLDRAVFEFSRKALVTTSSAVFLYAKAGRICYSVFDGKHCTPTWCDDDPRRVESLEICFQFERQEQIPGTLQTRTKKYWFRRIIDETNDTVFQLAEVTGAPPIWIVDAAQSTTHGLGFCPVVWVRTLPMSSDAIDGTPIVDPCLYKLLDRINYVYSLRGRSVEYTLDPQWVRKNVSPPNRAQLQKSPGRVWDIEDEDDTKKAEISLIEAEGSGSTTAGELLNDLRSRFAEACRVVLADTDKISGRDVSGVVLEYLHAPMVALASDLRKDLGDDAFVDLINIALRMICTIKQRGEDVFIQGASKAVKLMMTAQLGGPWLDFPIRLQWGRFFSPTLQDVQFAVTAATAAQTGGLVAKASASKYVSDYFGVTDIDAELEQIEDEKAEAQQQAIKTAQATAQAQPDSQSPPNAPPSKKPPKPNRPGKA